METTKDPRPVERTQSVVSVLVTGLVLWLARVAERRGVPLPGELVDALTVAGVGWVAWAFRRAIRSSGPMLLAFIVTGIGFGCATSGPWPKACPLVDAPGGGKTRACAGAVYKEVCTKHPTKPRPAGVVRYYIDDEPLPHTVTADDVGNCGAPPAAAPGGSPAPAPASGGAP